MPGCSVLSRCLSDRRERCVYLEISLCFPAVDYDMLVAAVSICSADLLKVSVVALAGTHVSRHGAAVHMCRVKVVENVILRFIPLFPFGASYFPA